MAMSNIKIYIFSVEYYLATKFEALNSRGGFDIRGSHDWEDIVYIMNNCAKLTDVILKCPDFLLVEYLQKQYYRLIENQNIREIIYSALPYHSEEENIDEILQIMKTLINKE